MQTRWATALLVGAGCAPVLPAAAPAAAPPGPAGGGSAEAPDTAGTPGATESGGAVPLDGEQGALVTTDCLYEDYEYAVDILLSCGAERFGEPLRLHTFKRHALDHGRVFNDQLLAHRDGRLWFDAYTPPRCVRVDASGRLVLSADPSACTAVVFAPAEEGHWLQDASTGRCAGLGTAACSDHRSTGGRECGGVDHRYLPLSMGDCSEALAFRFVSEARACAGEYPADACF